jgi:signal peptidase I
MEFGEANKVKKSPQTIALIKKIKMEKRKKILKKYKGLLIVLAILIVITTIVLVTLNIFVFSIGKIEMDNMSETIQIDDRVYIDKQFKKIDSGHIYQFEKEGKTLIDRCVGVAGDTIVIRNNKVYINHIFVSEKYISAVNPNEKVNIEVVVPEGKLFFLGDNRKNSWDSRYWTDKFVSETDVIGEVTDIVYPFDRSKKINNPKN